MLGPDLLGPESPFVVKIFLYVTDDVDLLQELAHGLVKICSLEQGGIGLTFLDEQAGAAFADQACHVVAILFVVLYRVDAVVFDTEFGVLDVVSHAVAHALGDVFDDGLVGGLQLLELLDDDVELDTELPVLLVGPVFGKGPAILLDDVVEVTEDGLLLGQGNGHVVFDGVEAAKDEVEDGDGDEDIRVKLEDDGDEAAARLG